jgi:hypothetical protein
MLRSGILMRLFAIAVLLSAAVAACAPFIPVKDDFGTSAAVPAGPIPPEFAEFNAYDPAINPLLADQMCATPYQPIEEQNVAGAGGRIVAARARCTTHIPFWGNDGR